MGAGLGIEWLGTYAFKAWGARPLVPGDCKTPQYRGFSLHHMGSSLN